MVLLKILGLDYDLMMKLLQSQMVKRLTRFLALYKATRASSPVDITPAFELFRSLKTIPLFPK